MQTLTENLAGRMAQCKQMQAQICKDMRAAHKVATERHDEAAAKVAEIDRQLEKDPYNAELQKQRGEYDNVREGLYACCGHANGLHEQVTGTPIVKPRHRAKGFGGKFAKKDSLEHALISLES